MKKRRSVLYVALSPLFGDGIEWKYRVYRMEEDVRRVLYYRALVRSGGRLVGDRCEVVFRGLGGKWHDRSGCSGVVEARAEWEEE